MTARALLQRFAPRLLVALLMGFGSEGLLWAGAADRPPLDNLLVVTGIAAAALILLDIIVRWHVRDLYGLAAVGGLFALSYSLLLNPISPERDLQLSLLTDVMGGQALIAMGMLLLFIALTGTAGRWAWLGVPLGGIIGACWGIWLRWASVSGNWNARPATSDTLLILGVGALAAIALTVWVCARVSPIPADSLKMGAYEGLFAGGVVIVALYRQFDGLQIDVPVYVVLSALGAICVAMLWYRKDSYFGWIGDPWKVKPAWAAFLATGAAFLVAAAFTYPLPRMGNPSLGLFEFIRLIFTLFGLIWLPGLTTLIGVKAVLRDIQSKPL